MQKLSLKQISEMNEATQIIADQVAEEMLRLKRLNAAQDAVAYLRHLLDGQASYVMDMLEGHLGEKFKKAELSA